MLSKAVKIESALAYLALGYAAGKKQQKKKCCVIYNCYLTGYRHTSEILRLQFQTRGQVQISNLEDRVAYLKWKTRETNL